MSIFNVNPFGHDGNKAPTKLTDHEVIAHSAVIAPAENAFAFARNGISAVILGAEDRFHNVELAAEAILHVEKIAAINEAGAKSAAESAESEDHVEKIVVNPFHHTDIPPVNDGGKE